MYDEIVDLDCCIKGTPEQIDAVLVAYQMLHGFGIYFVCRKPDDTELYWRSLGGDIDDEMRVICVWNKLSSIAEKLNLSHYVKITKRKERA